MTKQYKRLIVMLTVIVLSILPGIGIYSLVNEDKKEVVSAQQVTKDDYPEIWKNEPTADMYDSWGNQNRICASWVSWKVWQKYRVSTNNWNNASNSIWNKESDAGTIRVSGTTPRKHSVAVDNSYYPGHVMWVESVNDDGTINISEYNYVTVGEYSERTISADGLRFVYFN